MSIFKTRNKEILITKGCEGATDREIIGYEMVNNFNVVSIEAVRISEYIPFKVLSFNLANNRVKVSLGNKVANITEIDYKDIVKNCTIVNNLNANVDSMLVSYIEKDVVDLEKVKIMLGCIFALVVAFLLGKL